MLVRYLQNLGFITCLVSAGFSSACSTPRNPSVIPQPVQMEVGRGGFDLDADTRIVLSNPTNLEVQQLTESWARPIRATSGFNLLLVDTPDDAPSNMITLRLSQDAPHPVEGYRLNVTSDAVTVEAKTPAGLFYGLQTLTQLLFGDHTSGWSVPVVQIVDAPRFAYRGMHLDVGRHFFQWRL